MVSNRADNVYQFIQNLATTADDKQCFELLLAVDRGDEKTLAAAHKAKDDFGVSVKTIEFDNPDGYFSLNLGHNALIPLAHPDAYYDWLLNDEIRIKTQGWDTILTKFKHFFPDDIFRLRLSNFLLKNYYDIFECMPSPDNYSIQTREWMKIVKDWGECWAPDPWIECIDYFLRMDDNFIDNSGVWRSIPIFDIKLGGQEANQNQSEAVSEYKIKRIFPGWEKYTSKAYQEKYKRYACLIKAEILKRQYPNAGIEENVKKKKIILFKNIDTRIVLRTWNYHIPRHMIIFCDGYKKKTRFNVDSAIFAKLTSKFISIFARRGHPRF